MYVRSRWLAGPAFAGMFAITAHAQVTGVSPAPLISAYGQYVTLTAPVLPGCSGCPGPTPTGTVDFFVDGELAGSSPVYFPGIGSIALSTMAVGTRSLVAVYSGDANYSGNTSPASNAIVVPASTATSMSAPGAIALGQPLTVTIGVSVAQPGAGTPSGTVAVTDGVGDTCTVALPSTSCTLTPSAPGTLTLVARYAGDGNFNPSNGVRTLIVGATPHTVGGSIGGLAGNGLVLHIDHAAGSEDLPLAAGSTGFVFGSPIAYGSYYDVSVAAQPSNPRQACVVASGAGTMQGTDVTGVSVACTTNAYRVGGSVSGVVGGGLVLRLNGSVDLPVAADGAFAFPPLPDGTAYGVAIAAQPAGQLCTVAHGSGVLAGADVVDVAVACVSQFLVGGTFAGLEGSVVLQLNGADDLVVSSAGPPSFVFPQPLANGATYAVTVLSQPPNQTCSVANGAGIVAFADVEVFVQCQANGQSVLNVAVDDGSSYAHYGETLQYTVTLSNTGTAPAIGIPVSGQFGPGFDAAAATWQCVSTSGGGNCFPAGPDQFADVPEGGSVVWLVTVPVLADTDAPQLVFMVSAGPIADDVDTLVLHRDGFDGD